MLLATPFLRALRRGYPEARIVVHGKGHTLGLVEAEGLWDASVPLQKPGKLWPIQEGRRVAREAGPFDLALILPNSFSSAVVARLSGARERVGYALNGRSPLLTRPLPVKKVGRLRPIPMVDYYLAMLEQLGVSTEGIARRPQLSVSAEQRAGAEATLRAAGIAEGERVWALNFGGAWKTKRWVPHQGSQLIQLLRGEGITPFLLWGPGEEALRDEVAAGAGGTVPGAETLVPLGELTPLLEQVELMVSTDSGPRHFGVAAGAPVIVLVGGTHPDYTHVDYDRYRVLCAEVECWPCHLKTCPIDFRCMKLLTPPHVLQAGLSLLKELEDRPA
ncbi:MAG: glycosyltransferase family 9 protein [Planctomycetes bacterium]|nr:glycosyltransferase family 9 protein [Planctomycetota bacterium]